MTHLKNTTTPASVQHARPTTRVINFADVGKVGELLLCVNAGVPAVDALELAAALAMGVHQLCQRLHAGINDGDAGYCDEVFALGFLAETAGSITRAVCQSGTFIGDDL